MEKEIWKRIKDFPDYEISNWGRVKSYKRDKINGRILKTPPGNNGYAQVNIYNPDSKKMKHFHIHRLVAESFIPNPENKEHVNHIDENKLNNYVGNLNWMTPKENNNHGTHNEKISKKVRCLETGKIYCSGWEAYRQTGISHIHCACNGDRKTAGGFHWEYVSN